MAHLLHIDSSIRVEGSVTRALSARAAGVWRAAHPGGTVTYRDLGASPVPHLDTRGGLARNTPTERHTPAQAVSWKLSVQLVDELKQADTILLGLPLYNFGAPSSIKAWVDHVVAGGLSVDFERGEACSAAASSSCSLLAVADTRPAPLGMVGTTRSSGFPTVSPSPASSLASSSPS